MDSVQSNQTEMGEQIVRNVTCPHCWSLCPSSDVVWISTHDELRDDPILTRDDMLRFLPTRFDINGDAMDMRNSPCQELACPRCHLPIPRELLTSEAAIFSIIGTTASGKSYYLASAAWELSRILAQQFCMGFGDINVASNSTVVDHKNVLFANDNPDQEVAIEKTQIGARTHYNPVIIDEQEIRFPKPFLFNLRPQKKHPGFGQIRNNRILCLYDNAGENFIPGADTTLSPGTRHMARSKVLMFLFDPIQDSRFRDLCRRFSDDPQLYKSGRIEMQSHILEEATRRIRQYAHLNPHDKLRQPLIVLLPKSDIWGHLLEDTDITTEPYIETNSPSDPQSFVDVERVNNVSQQIGKLLLEVAPEFVTAAENCSDEVVYIPVSALGCSPKNRESDNILVVRPKDIRPRWVTVPFIFAFTVWAKGLFVPHADF